MLRPNNAMKQKKDILLLIKYLNNVWVIVKFVKITQNASNVRLIISLEQIKHNALRKQAIVKNGCNKMKNNVNIVKKDTVL